MNNDKRPPLCLLTEGQTCSAWVFGACLLLLGVIIGYAVMR